MRYTTFSKRTGLLEASLRRLGTDHLDLYWAHWPDLVTPVEEIAATFDDLVRQGKILYGGLSNFPRSRESYHHMHQAR